MVKKHVGKKTVASFGEFGLIDRMKKIVGPLSRGIVGIGDDAAVMPLDKKRALLCTTDMLVENVHFRRA
jgi:thiamine-monophosphate kinase